jgi:hypothetical protein
MVHKGLLLMPALVLFAACSTQPSSPTVVFRGDHCRCRGPDFVPAEFTVHWILEDPVTSGAILQFVTIDPGKTVEELATIPAEDPPPAWVHKLNYDVGFTPGNYTSEINLGDNSDYSGEPLYIVCFYADRESALGAVGPIRVTS